MADHRELAQQHNVIKQQARKIEELEKKISELQEQLVKEFFGGSYIDNITHLENLLHTFADKIKKLENAISDADSDIRSELQWAGIIPAGPNELKWSVQGILDSYRKLSRR